MLPNQPGHDARLVNLKLLAMSLAVALGLGSPHVLAQGDTGKSLAACKVKIATVIEGRHRVKLDKVRTSRLRLKVLFPNAPRQVLWCDHRGGETRLFTVAGAPFAVGKSADEQMSTKESLAEARL